MSPRIGLDWQTLLQAATEIADTRGIDAVSMASLAKKLAIRSPSLYNHVDSLDALRKELAIHGIEQLHSTLTRAAIGRSGDDSVRALGEAYVAFVRAHPGLYEATHRVPNSLDPDLQRAQRKMVDTALRVLHVYGLEDEAALHAVRGLRSILHGFASLEQRGGFGLPLDLDVSLRLLIDTFLAGLHTMRQNVIANSKSE